MKGLIKRFENIFTALAFAEAGEHEKAREFLAGIENTCRADILEEIPVCPDMPLVLEEYP